jgi:hypothetical protein
MVRILCAVFGQDPRPLLESPVVLSSQIERGMMIRGHSEPEAHASHSVPGDLFDSGWTNI